MDNATLKIMRRGITLAEFIYPALNSGKYGSRLEWIDKERGLFSVKFKHKNDPTWESADAELFSDWDIIKRRQPNGRNPKSKYSTDVRQRFRAAIHGKCCCIQALPPRALIKLGITAEKSTSYFLFDKPEFRGVKADLKREWKKKQANPVIGKPEKRLRKKLSQGSLSSGYSSSDVDGNDGFVFMGNILTELEAERETNAIHFNFRKPVLTAQQLPAKRMYIKNGVLHFYDNDSSPKKNETDCPKRDETDCPKMDETDCPKMDEDEFVTVT